MTKRSTFLFMKNGEVDVSALQKYIIFVLWPNVCCCPSVQNASIFNTKVIPLEENVNLNKQYIWLK